MNCTKQDNLCAQNISTELIFLYAKNSANKKLNLGKFSQNNGKNVFLYFF